MGRSSKELEQLKHSNYENARSDFVAITEKNGEQYVRLRLSRYTRDPKGIFLFIDGFTDERVVQCDVQV